MVMALVDRRWRRPGYTARPTCWTATILQMHRGCRYQPAQASFMRRRCLPPARGALKPALAPPSDRQCQLIDRDRHPTGSATRVAQVVLSGKLVIETDAGTMPNRPARIRGRRYLEVVRAVWAATRLCRDEEVIGSTRCSMRMPLPLARTPICVGRLPAGLATGMWTVREATAPPTRSTTWRMAFS
jgi:hypothetical protein